LKEGSIEDREGGDSFGAKEEKKATVRSRKEAIKILAAKLCEGRNEVWEI